MERTRIPLAVVRKTLEGLIKSLELIGGFRQVIVTWAFMKICVCGDGLHKL